MRFRLIRCSASIAWLKTKKRTLTAERNKEATYIKKGVRSWKEAPKCFEEHHLSKCHKIATVYHVVLPKCTILPRENIRAEKLKERICLLDVSRYLRYLCRQGVALLQGHKGEDNFTQLAVLLAADDENILDHLNKSYGNKYIGHYIQNELSAIMA